MKLVSLAPSVPMPPLVAHHSRFLPSPTPAFGLLIAPSWAGPLFRAMPADSAVSLVWNK
jgi:hypothetical protein